MRAFLLLLLPALAVHAVPFPPPLTPERPVSEAVSHVASGNQHTPVLASNGEIALVAWIDERDRLERRIYASRIDAAGNVLDPAGVLLSSDGYQTLGGVVWNGTHFAVALQELGVWELVFVAPDGTVAGRRALDIHGEWADATDGGPGVRMLFLTTGERAAASIVDGDGDVIMRNRSLVGADQRGEKTIAGSRGSEFLVLLQVRRIPDAGFRMLSVRIDGEDGRIVSSRDSAISPDLFIYSNWESALEGGPAGWLVVAPEQTRKRLLLQKLDVEGVASGVPAVLFEPPGNQYVSTRVRIVRESGHFTVVWSSGLSFEPTYTHVAFVTDDGVAGPSRRLQEWPGYGASALLATAGGLRLLVTGSSTTGHDSDLFAQTVTDALTATTPVPIAHSPLAQSRVSAAAARNGYLTAWIERGPDPATHLLVRRVLPDGTFQGPPLEAGRGVSGDLLEDVTVVSNGTHYLVTWRNGTSALGRRMDAETGFWIDAAPFTIGEAWALAAASNGSDAVAVWSGACDNESCLQSRRIHLAGDPLTDPVVTLLQSTQATELAIASNGTDYLAAWALEQEWCECLDPDPTPLLALRLRADATKLDAAPLVLVGTDANSWPAFPAVAWNADRYLVAWSMPQDEVKVEGALVTAEGAILASRVPLVRGGVRHSAIPRLLAHRDQFILFALEGAEEPPAYERVASWTAVSFDAEAPLDRVASLPRTVIADDPVLTLGAASSGSAVLVAYDRFTPPDAGGVARAFTRLFGFGTGGRRRAVR